jgi:hypothetical protein
MFRKVILILLTLTAVGSAVLGIATRQRPLYYWPKATTVPCEWKLYTAQSGRGHFRISFESYEEWQPLSQEELKQREAEAKFMLISIPPVDSPRTWRDRLSDYGFSAYSGNATAFGTGSEGERAVEMKTEVLSIGCGLPAWFVCVAAGAYPAIALVRGPMLRRCYRRKRGLCERCAYDLTGNTSGVCPECGTPTRVGEVATP